MELSSFGSILEPIPPPGFPILVNGFPVHPVAQGRNGAFTQMPALREDDSVFFAAFDVVLSCLLCEQHSSSSASLYRFIATAAA